MQRPSCPRLRVEPSGFILPRRTRSSIHVNHAIEYAIRSLLVILDQPGEKMLASADIARTARIPCDSLRRILRVMKRARIVEVVRGSHGGVWLTRRPEDITLCEVVEAVIGPLALTDCTQSPAACPRARHCPAHPVFRQAQDRFRATLASVTLASLSNGRSWGGVSA